MGTNISKKGERLLEVSDLYRNFPVGKGKGFVHALRGLSFSIDSGETLGLVGESGCGKSTAGRIIARLDAPTSGQVRFRGQNLFKLPRPELKNARRDIQIIFQDPFASLDPRMTIGSQIEEPLIIHGIGDSEERRRMACEFLERVGIARALILRPALVICDELVSALDVSVQSQILNLLADLQKDLGLTYLFIAHGLNVVQHISNRIGVMYLGRIVELLDASELFESAVHPYTQALLSAMPVPDPSFSRQRVILKGDVPSPVAQSEGCAFHGRCPFAQDICRRETPPERRWGSHMAACHFPQSAENRIIKENPS